MTDISGMFLHPYILLLLPIGAVFFLFRIRCRREVSLPPAEMGKPSWAARAAFYLGPLLESVLVLLLIVSAAGPYKERQGEMISQEGVDIVLALDISASMQAADFRPNRLEALKDISSGFVGKSGAHRTGVCVFANQVFTQSPMTTDRTVLRELIDGIAFEMIDHGVSGGTAIGDALAASAETLERVKIQGRDQVIILISDGQSNTGIDPVTAGEYCADSGIKLYVIGIGGEEAVPVYVNGKPFINVHNEILKTRLDDSQLKEIALAGKGIYYRAKDENVLADIFGEIANLESTPLKRESYTVKRIYRAEISMVLIFVYMLLLASEGIFLRRPWR